MVEVPQSRPQEPPSRVVTVERHGASLYVEPPCADVLRALATVSRVAVEDGKYGYQIRGEVESLLHQDPVDRDAGLELIVWRLLHRAGYQVERRWCGERPRPLPVPDVAEVRQYVPCDEQLFDFVRANYEGVIRYSSPNVNLAWLIAEMALAMPEAKIAVAVASKDAAQRLVRQIRRWIPDAAMATAKYCPQRYCRVIVSTFIGLADPWIEIEQRDIVVVPDARQAVSKHGRIALCPMDARFRLFGMLPAACKPAPRERDRMVAIFGLEELEVPRHGYRRRPIQTIFLPIKGGPRIPLDASVLALKRKGIWTHPVRNRRVARIASAARTADTGWLDQHAPALSRAVQSEQPRTVLVLVDTVDHALELAERLPGWPLVTGPEVIQDGLDRRQCRRLAERRALERAEAHCIATTAGLAMVNMQTVDIVIWAGGGRHLPPLPMERLVYMGATERPLLVVDFIDRHHPGLRRQSVDRMAAYATAGWFPPGVDPLLARVDTFLAERPRRSGS